MMLGCHGIQCLLLLQLVVPLACLSVRLFCSECGERTVLCPPVGRAGSVTCLWTWEGQRVLRKDVVLALGSEE